MYKIDRSWGGGGAQKSFFRKLPIFISADYADRIVRVGFLKICLKIYLHKK